MHKLLSKQLQKARRPDGEVDLDRFMELVAQAYEEEEQDRARTDRSIALMVEEIDAWQVGLQKQITERTAELTDSRKALKLQNKRMAAALDTTGNAVSIFDGKERLVYCNQRFLDLYRLWGAVDEPTWYVAGRAVQLVEWQRNHQFCGRCGTATVDAPGERARVCPECKLLAYPRLAPAVIMLLEREDGKALLARNKNFPAGMFSTLAGFVEPGESLEDAVAREVKEETGVELSDIEYHSSQPWPFPSSLMLGFTARAASERVQVDGLELEDARWFTREELSGGIAEGRLRLPSPASIAFALVDGWLRG